MTTVNSACACRIRDANEDASPTAIAEYRNPNWPADMSSPMSARSRQATRGRGTTAMNGRMQVNRIATKSKGGTPSNPSWMTTKFNPQMRTTSSASAW